MPCNDSCGAVSRDGKSRCVLNWHPEDEDAHKWKTSKQIDIDHENFLKRREQKKALKAEKAKNDSYLEELLCSACRVLEKKKYDFDENPSLSRWWDLHKKVDRKRALSGKKAKKLLSKAVKNLTTSEKKFLRSKGLI